MRDATYSPDVEVNERGQIVAARDLERGERIAVPLHMLRTITSGNNPIR